MRAPLRIRRTACYAALAALAVAPAAATAAQVAVTGLNATDNPAPGVGVMRALRAASPGDRLVGLAYDALDPGIYAKDLAAEVFLIPYPSHGVEAFLDRLDQHAERGTHSVYRLRGPAGRRPDALVVRVRENMPVLDDEVVLTGEFAARRHLAVDGAAELLKYATAR